MTLIMTYHKNIFDSIHSILHLADNEGDAEKKWLGEMYEEMKAKGEIDPTPPPRIDSQVKSRLILILWPRLCTRGF